MQKKSQIQMGESVAVIIIVVVLIIIGIAFWNNFSRNDYKNLEVKDEELQLIELSKVAAELPELRCFSAQSVIKVNCFDYYKILALNSSMQDPETFRFYSNYFKTSRITFKQIYPEEYEITIYDNNITAQSQHQISMPIIIEKNTGRNSIKTFGLIIVEGYYR